MSENSWEKWKWDLNAIWCEINWSKKLNAAKRWQQLSLKDLRSALCILQLSFLSQTGQEITMRHFLHISHHLEAGVAGNNARLLFLTAESFVCSCMYCVITRAHVSSCVFNWLSESRYFSSSNEAHVPHSSLMSCDCHGAFQALLLRFKASVN